MAQESLKKRQKKSSTLICPRMDDDPCLSQRDLDKYTLKDLSGKHSPKKKSLILEKSKSTFSPHRLGGVDIFKEGINRLLKVEMRYEDLLESVGEEEEPKSKKHKIEKEEENLKDSKGSSVSTTTLSSVLVRRKSTRAKLKLQKLIIFPDDKFRSFWDIVIVL
jgi:hypothetical protein